MWLVTQHGFFNIIEQDSDRAKGLLTIKARRREDLETIETHIHTAGPIEESNITDYKYRVKASKIEVLNLMAFFATTIDYPKTKPRLTEKHPNRAGVYFAVWDVLTELQK